MLLSNELDQGHLVQRVHIVDSAAKATKKLYEAELTPSSSVQ